jgi:hypothetical protein
MSADDSPPYTWSVFRPDDWLAQAEGFVVEGSNGRLGVVEELRFESRADRPDALVVRAGRFARRRLVIPVDAVEDVIPRKKLIRLRTAAGPGAP